MSDQQRQALAARFERHADEEGKILNEYRAFAEQLGDSSAGNLIMHILTEEELHHLLLRTLAEWMRQPPREREDALPPNADRAQLLRLTQTLQKHEMETIESCRGVRSQLAGRDAELLGTLLDAVVMDSEKHHRLLVGIEKLLAG